MLGLKRKSLNFATRHLYFLSLTLSKRRLKMTNSFLAELKLHQSTNQMQSVN